MFTESFDRYSCIGDSISCESGPFTVTARIEFDPEYHIGDDDCHNPDQSIAGRNDEQQEKLLAARSAWENDAWFYCGIVLSVAVAGVVLDRHAASLWGIECNYPGSDNSYLTDVANELLDEALETGRQVLETIKAAA